MKKVILLANMLLLISSSCVHQKNKDVNENKDIIRLITLNPGHFHAALVQKENYENVSDSVYVYAPEGEDIKEHLKKIEDYNSDKEKPTKWNEIVYTGNDFLEKMLSEKKGNVMVTAGNNKLKTEYIKKALAAGINVLADKPMAINKEQFETLKECFNIAAQNDLLLYDIMTERFEITTILQKELSLMPEVYGEQTKGSANNPAVIKESVHHFFKNVSGKPLKRPMWFFDTEQEGEGIVDVTTHLVDLVQWETFPNEIIDYTKDIVIIDANRWSTPISKSEFKQVSGSESFPEYLKKDIKNDTLNVYCNGDIVYKIKDVYAKVSVIWNYTFPEGGGDTHYSVMKGSKANLVIKQSKNENYKPELFIEINEGIALNQYEEYLKKSLVKLTEQYPGIELESLKKGTWHIKIPDSYRLGHEAHFGQVTKNYIHYLETGNLPEWEEPNMITKYYITTSALELAKKKTKK